MQNINWLVRLLLKNSNITTKYNLIRQVGLQSSNIIF